MMDKKKKEDEDDSKDNIQDEKSAATKTTSLFSKVIRNKNTIRTSLLAAYFWGVLTAYALLSMYSSSSDTTVSLTPRSLDVSSVTPPHHALLMQHSKRRFSQEVTKQRQQHKQRVISSKKRNKIEQVPKKSLPLGVGKKTNKVPPEVVAVGKKAAPKAPQQQQQQQQQPLIKQQDSTIVLDLINPAPTSLAGLSTCAKYGGPETLEAAQEMVYWRDIPTDNRRQSPFMAPNRYLTFEPDMGGWNNIRMAMETTIALAYSMGRTLVLPPAQQMYLLDKTHNETSSRPHFSFADFFDMYSITEEHAGVNIITTQEFFERIQNSEDPGLDTVPTRTNWDGKANGWNNFMRNNAVNVLWDPYQCLAYFPSSPDQEMKPIQQSFARAVEKYGDESNWEQFIDNPLPINATSEERLGEFMAGRKHLCLYRPRLQQAPVLHFPAELPKEYERKKKPGWEREIDPRLLVHFYAFLFFPNVHHELWLKRFVRDHVRYIDEIQCAGARVVAALREKAQKEHGKADGAFHTMHVRRGDFQYKHVWIPAEKILEATQKQFKDGDVVFIATDEKEKEFFQPLREHYTLYFLDDFIKDGTVGSQVNKNYYGMIDQLVASRGKIFFGCWFSTFTAYIMRLRGYHSQLQKDPGYDEGKLLNSFYYVTENDYDQMLSYKPVHQPFWSREFPTAWRLLDRDLNETMIAVSA